MANKDKIIDVLKVWAEPKNGFDGYWHGYDALEDETQIDIPTLKKEMKLLAKDNLVELRPTYSDEYKISGRGWFLSA